MQHDPASTWRFAGAELNPLRRSVTRAGQRTELDRGATAVLLCLLRQAPQTAAKDALLRAGWPGRVVTENSLSKAIARIRAALADEDGAIVESVHGFGYRIVAAIETVAPAAATIAPTTTAAPAQPVAMPAARRPHHAPLLIATLLMLAVTGAAALWLLRQPDAATAPKAAASALPSLMVLPFRSLSAETEARDRTRLLARDLAVALSQQPGRRILAPDTLELANAHAPDIEALARRLHAALALTGVVEWREGRVHVSTELVRTSDATLVWSNAFDGTVAGWKRLCVDIQSEVVRAADFALSDLGRREEARGTRSAEAYAEFRKGATLFKDDETGGRRALVAYERAVAIDPDYTEAWLALADLLSHNGFYASDAAEALAGKHRAVEILDQVLEREPDNVRALSMRGALRYSHAWDWAGAEADYDRVAQLAGADHLARLVNLARIRGAQGRLDEAITLARRASALNPGNTSGLTHAAHLEIARGRLAEGMALAQRAAGVAPIDEHAHYYLGLGALLGGDTAGALAHFDDSAHVLRLAGRAAALYSASDRAGSDRELAQLAERYGHLDAFRVAEVHAWRGESDLAFQWLDRALAQHEASFYHLSYTPLLQDLHADPRFAALKARIGL